MRSCVVCGVLEADARSGRFCGEKCRRAAADIRRILDGRGSGRSTSVADAIRMVPRKRPDVEADDQADGQFDPGQRRRAIQVIESLPWADAEDAIVSLEQALFRAVEATSADFALWRTQLEDHFEFELFIAEGDIAAMSAEERWGYVSSLLRIAVDTYGVWTDGEGDLPPGLQEEEGSLAALLRGLLDILYTPVLDHEPHRPRSDCDA